MAADVFSTTLGWLQMGTGNDNNSWGLNHNESVSQIFENAIAGSLAVPMAGGTYDLSANPPPTGPSGAGYKILNCTGTAATLKVPNLTMDWVVFNNTSGDFLMQTPSGTAVCIPQGTDKRVWCDGANGLYRHDRNEVGKIETFGTQSIPAGYFECTGVAFSNTAQPDLFGKIGYVWGGSGSAPLLPLLTDTGRYLRSRIPGTNDAGAYLANAFAAHTHTTTVTDPGHIHGITDPGHTHVVADPGHIHSITDPSHNHDYSDPGHTHNNSLNDPGHTHTVNGSGSASNNSGIAGAVAITTFTAVNSNTTGISINNASAGTNILIAFVGTGISVNSHTTGISVNSTTTGISMTKVGTGISVGVNSAGSASETRPETAVVRMCIRY